MRKIVNFLILKHSLIFLVLELSEQQREFRETTRKFVHDEIIPKAGEYDRTGEYPWPIIKKAHENGLLNFEIPEKYGESMIMG